MSLSAEYCSDKTGDRGGGGGALAHQRRLIRGLLVWAILLTLGLAASITLHFIDKPQEQREQQDQKDQQDQQDHKKHIQPCKVMGMDNLVKFSPNWPQREKVDLLHWNTSNTNFIEGIQQGKQFRVNCDGLYFLYLQVTLDPDPHPEAHKNHTITMQSKKNGVLLKGLVNGSKLSTGFMGKGVRLSKGDTFNVTCKPKAKIQFHTTETYLEVIKLY